MSNKIFTYFGVPVPPWKEEKVGRGGLTLTFVLTGKIPSKKNNMMTVTVRKKAREWANKEAGTGRPATWDDVHRAIGMVTSKVRPNGPYNKFLAKVKPALLKQAAEWSGRLYDKGLIFPIPKAQMTLKLHFRDQYVTDTVNKQQTIQDALVDAGIIADDDYRSLNPIKAASASYYEEILSDIALVTLFFNPVVPQGEGFGAQTQSGG